MLVLSRNEGECIHIGDDVVVTIVRTAGGRVRVGVQAPRETNIVRGELIGIQADSGAFALNVSGAAG